jgi:chromosome segregation and condensation protein ScpB
MRPPPGLRVQRHAEQFRLVTDAACAAGVERYRQRTQRPQALSQAQREVLAIVAYAQPPSRARVDEVRGTSGRRRSTCTTSRARAGVLPSR